MLDFVALDFETANKYKNSACSLAVVTVKNGEITKTGYSLIKPPFMQFDEECIEIHGIQPAEVLNEKTFDQLWDQIYENHLKGNILLAHNARFDMGVLRATLDHYKIPWPNMDYVCTVKLSRKVWPDLVNHRLNTMAALLGIEFKHHYALDDAETCAKIALAAAQVRGVNSLKDLLKVTGVPLTPFIDDKNKEAQKALHKASEPEQMAFF
mgnify:CR=1 FL=1